MEFTIRNHQVLVDGRPTVILSGAIHYFRTLPEQWHDRLVKLKHCGFNTVETYLAWHLHERREGEFDFSGRLDFVRFIEEAGALGLYVIVRPGPYICSECDLGGLPGWLLGKPGIRLRCCNETFLDHVWKFFDRALPLIAPLQCTHGGPVIAMQVENEYGSYGADKSYLRLLASHMRSCGISVQFFTSDGACESCLKTGTLPELPATVNYREAPKRNMKALDACETGYENAPFTTELWVGEVRHWGKFMPHHDDESVARDIRDILDAGASVNCYMFHGGTNFGFTSGANMLHGVYLPQLTSYECDALLDEAGNPTEKYHAVQRVIEEHFPGSTAPVSPSPSRAYEAIECTGYVPLTDALDALGSPVTLPLPEPMEYFGQSFGFILYSATVEPFHSGDWEFQEMRDRALVMLDGKPVTALFRNDAGRIVYLDIRHEHSRLDILVENMGRINYGMPMESEKKGMRGFHRPGGLQQLNDWTIRPLPLDDLGKLTFREGFPDTAAPGFYRAVLRITGEAQDTFLRFPEGTRGYVWVNGFNIGRYWTVGPQRTLYIPRPLLKTGENEIVIFEVHTLRSPRLEFSARRLLDRMGERG